jgi:hypothetical protein
MIKLLLCIVCVLLALNLAYGIHKGYKEHSVQDPISTAVSLPTPNPITHIPPGVRKQVIDGLIEQVINDPVVHLKYWYWGGHSPDDLSRYIWIKYRDTKWKVPIEEAQVLKSRAMEILDRIYKQKAEKRFK